MLRGCWQQIKDPGPEGSGVHRAKRRALLLISSLFLLLLTRASAGSGDEEEEVFIGLDYGSEWIKIAVAHGTAIDIVLNENTQRKSLAALSFPDVAKSTGNELRLFGEAAMARPHLALQYVRELLGSEWPRSSLISSSMMLTRTHACTDTCTIYHHTKFAEGPRVAVVHSYLSGMHRATAQAEQYVRPALFPRHHRGGPRPRLMPVCSL